MQLNKINLTLLDYEVDIIVQALQDYMYGINSKYNFRRIPKTEDEATEKLLAKYIYEKIEFCRENKVISEKIA